MYGPEVDNPEYIEKQWYSYMGDYTSLSLMEAYEIYIKSRKTPADKLLLQEIRKRSLAGNGKTFDSDNPFIFRFCPPKN